MKIVVHIKCNLPLSCFSAVWKYRLRSYYFREIKSTIYAFFNQNAVSQKEPKILYIVGMPRTGSTLVKRFLGEHKSLIILPKKLYQKPYTKALKNEGSNILIDKSTDNIDYIHNLSGENAWFSRVVRDPRDELISLSETDRHSAVHHNRTFWPYWTIRYSRLLESFKIIQLQCSNVAIVRYEDLVQNPVPIKELFCRWINLDMENITNEYGSSIEEMAYGVNKSEYWKAHQHDSVHNDSLHRWKQANTDIRNTTSETVIKTV